MRILPAVIFPAILALFLTSCFKEDERVAPHEAGNFTTDTVALTDTYKCQVYYSLSDSNTVLTNLKTIWDLGFESSSDGWRVVLNSSCFMKAAFLEGQDFGLPVDTTGALWQFNPSDGSADSLAIGHWFSVQGSDTLGLGRLMVIDRGMDEKGIPRGFRQLMIDSLSGGTYYFRMAAYNGSDVKSYAVSKKTGVNYSLFSIADPSAQPVEPPAANWDLLFSQYTTLLFTDAGVPYPYLVTGVTINPYLVEIAADSLTPFSEIDYEKANSLSFTRQADRIGYNWKRYDFDAGTYTVNPDLVFVIRDTKGYLYKFRFIGYYKYHNNTLEKGYPSFEYQKL
jgi:hypothetical protein